MATPPASLATFGHLIGCLRMPAMSLLGFSVPPL